MGLRQGLSVVLCLFSVEIHFLLRKFDIFCLCSVAGSLGVPALNGATPAQQSITMPMVAPTAMSAPVLPAQVLMPPEPIGNPSECLLLKNMFDPATEVC